MSCSPVAGRHGNQKGEGRGGRGRRKSGCGEGQSYWKDCLRYMNCKGSLSYVFLTAYNGKEWMGGWIGGWVGGCKGAWQVEREGK